jgi:predicted ribosome quality control (RQC) complex YloA/Tae2 family protein
MTYLTDRYVNFFTDYGFKRLFGEEPNKDRLDRVPDSLREQVFEKFFEVAEIANFTREEVDRYEDSLKYYRDLKNSFDTAREEGREEGVLIVARNLLDILDDATIAMKTGLSQKEVAALRMENEGITSS